MKLKDAFVPLLLVMGLMQKSSVFDIIWYEYVSQWIYVVIIFYYNIFQTVVII